MHTAGRFILITVILTLVMVIGSCQSGGRPTGILKVYSFRGEYTGTYEVIVNAGERDEHSYVWQLYMYFDNDEYWLMAVDSSGNACEVEGTFELELIGLLGRIVLADTALCTGWFEGTDFSAQGPRGEFETIHIASEVTMYRHGDGIWEIIRMGRVFY